jgi:hypothetical protein
MKVLNWIIAFLGLWEFTDITALFVSDFGKIPAFLWNHIFLGFLLMFVGVWAARTSHPLFCDIRPSMLDYGTT